VTTYKEGTIWDYPELQEPAPIEFWGCECGYVGDMPLRQTCRYYPATRTSPEELAEYIATCPQCGLEHDTYGDRS